MRALRLATLFCFLAYGLHAEIVWSGKPKPGFFFAVDLPQYSTSLESKAIVKVIAEMPDGYHLDREQMRRQLMDFPGYGPAPFFLVSEEALIKEQGVKTIIYALDPKIPGDQAMTFGLVTFLPDDRAKAPPVKLMTGVFFLKTTQAQAAEGYNGLAAPLLPLSEQIAVGISSENREHYLENQEIRLLSLEQKKTAIVHKVFWTAIVSLAILALALLAKRKRKPIPSRILIKKARERAATKIQDLYYLYFPMIRQEVDFYSALADLVRSFIEEACLLRTSTMTTQEFIEQMNESSLLSLSEQEELASFLRQADMVKFGKIKPSREECQQAFHSAREIIAKLAPFKEKKNIGGKNRFFWMKKMI